MVDNAFGKGMRKAVGEGVDKIIDETGSVLGRAWDFIKKESDSILE